MKYRLLRRWLAVALVLSLVTQTLIGFAGGADLMYRHKLIGGTSTFSVKLSEALPFTRDQLSKIVCELGGLSDEVKHYKGNLEITDKDAVGAWAVPYVGVALKHKLIDLKAGNVFDPKAIVTEKEIGTAFLRVLGYEIAAQDMDGKLAEMGIPASDLPVKRGPAFDYIWKVITAPLTKEGEALAVKYGKVDKEAAVTSFPNGVKYSKNFRINYLDDGVKLMTDGENRQFLLLPEGAGVPKGYEDYTVIRTPIRRAVVTSTPFVDYMGRFGKENFDRIAAVTTKKEYWTIPEIVEKMDQGAIVYIDQPYGAPLNPEAVIQAKPDVVLVDFGNAEANAKLYEQLKAFKIPVVCVNEWTETHLNGKVEWLKFFGALLDKDVEADEIFSGIIAKKNAVYEQAKKRTSKENQVVASGSIYDGKVWISGASSAMAQILPQLGGDYVYADLPGGSQQVTLEDFVAKSKDADILIYNSMEKYLGGLDTLLQSFPQLKEFKAYKNNRIYIQQNSFYMSKTEEYEMLEDLLAMLHPDVLKNHVFKKYMHLDVKK